MKHPSINRSVYLFAALPPLGFAVALGFLLHQRGASFTPDTFTYLGIARNLAERAAFLDYMGQSFTLVPPVFPVILAIFRLMGVTNPDAVALMLNPCCYAVVIFSVLWMISRIVKDDREFLLHAFFTPIYTFPIFLMSLWLLSELPFIMFTGLFFVAAVWYGEKQDTTSFVFLCVTASLAALTRYAGVAVILTGILFLVTGTGRHGMKHGLLFGVFSALSSAAWVWRNYLSDGTLLGPRLPFAGDWTSNIIDYLFIILRWYLPGRIATEPWLVFVIGVLLSVAALWLFRDIRFRQHQAWTLARLCIIFTAAYSLVMVLAVSTVRMDSLDTRLLAPIALPLALLFMIMASWGLRSLPIAENARNGLLLGLLAVIALIPVYRLAAVTEYRPQGLAAKRWSENPLTIRAGNVLAQHPDAYLLSNMPMMFSWHSGLAAGRSVIDPAGPYGDFDRFVRQQRKIQDILSSGRKVFVVWYETQGTPISLPPVKLASIFAIDTVISMREGCVITLTDLVAKPPLDDISRQDATATEG